MLELKACTACFSTDVKLYNMDSDSLRHEYNLVAGLKTAECVGMPKYLCVECSAFVRRFIKFRKKCQRAHFALQEILLRNKEIKLSKIEAIDRKRLEIMPSLSIIDISRTNYEEVQFQWTKTNRLALYNGDDIPIIHHSTYASQVIDMPKKQPNLSPEVKISYVKEEVEEAVNEKFTVPCTEQLNLEQSISIVKDDEDTDNFDNDDNNPSDHSEEDLPPVKVPEKIKIKAKASVKKVVSEGSSLDEEYASMVIISDQEAQAAVDVYRLFSNGSFRCEVCNKGYHNQQRLTAHLRMHDQHVSGNFLCKLCNYFYKTDYLLKTHITEKHMYKYECKKCTEVSFDRLSAKQHYIWAHLQRGGKRDANWYESRPKWLSSKGGKRVKGVVTIRPVRKITKLPPDFPVYSPVKHEEQYDLILERKKSRNYMEAEYKCEFCYRGFRAADTYNKHMRKHDPAYAGEYQCDMCKLYFKSPRKVYRHMNITHLFKYSCQHCKFVSFNKGQAHMHYRWHKNVTYQCPHCEKEFKKASTRLTHIRIKHPSTNICNLCGHSFVSENGLYCHKQLAHSTEERDVMEQCVADPADALFCADCDIQFLNQPAYTTHLGSSSKHASTNLSIVKPVRRDAATTASGERRKRGRPRCSMFSSEVLNNGTVTSTSCDICGEHQSNDVQARKHYAEQHPGAEFLKRYMCDVCGHTTKQYANLMVHMRTHTNEKPYECPHCDRRFSMPSNRDRHLVVHTGEKRYQCQHCNRRFTQSTAVKLHIQTVHLKIPYKPWEKKNRKRRKEEVPVSSVNVSALGAALLPQHKLLIETQGDYLNAFISYNDE